MSSFLVPLTNLIIEQTLYLGEVILVPIHNYDEMNIDIPNNIHSILKTNSSLYNYIDSGVFVIAFLPTDITSPTEKDLENALHLVDRSLDYLRLIFCRFDLRDTLPGIPGLVKNERCILLFDSTANILHKYSLQACLFSQQPGIGLQIDYLNNYQSDDYYKVFFSARTDEIYLEHRAILSRICYAFHLIDLNRCFCYLHSTLERMGGEANMQFKEKKKRIIGFIANSQDEYDLLSQHLFFYSKTIRTEIVHKGKDLCEILSIYEINQLLNNLFSVILKYCCKVISSNITSFSELESALEEKAKLFISNSLENKDTEFQNNTILDNEKHIFVAEMFNLNITVPLKQGNIIYLPADSVKNFYKYYYTYIYLDILEEHHLDPSDYESIQLGDKTLLRNEEFINFTAYDLDIILYLLAIKEFQKLNAETVLAIIYDEPFLKDRSYSFNSYSAFADSICYKINHGLDYIILSSFDICQYNYLPSLAGIHDSIRCIYRIDDSEKILHPIPGKVFSQYLEGEEFIINPPIQITNPPLYEALFNKKQDEISKLCEISLKRIVDCYYINDFTVQISYMFDILDMLDPRDTSGRKLKTRILPFIAASKTDYHQKCQIFDNMRRCYRTPLLHGGQNIFNLTKDTNEIYNIFRYIQDIIISFCTTIVQLKITSFEKFDSELELVQKHLGL